MNNISFTSSDESSSTVNILRRDARGFSRSLRDGSSYVAVSFEVSPAKYFQELLAEMESDIVELENRPKLNHVHQFQDQLVRKHIDRGEILRMHARADPNNTKTRASYTFSSGDSRIEADAGAGTMSK